MRVQVNIRARRLTPVKCHQTLNIEVKMKKKVLSQGHFDGFCLLYSVLNTYKTLLKPNQSSIKFTSDHYHKRQKIIAITPSLQNFASGEGSDFGVSRDKTDINLKERYINDCFFVLTEGMKSKISSKRVSLDEIQNIDFSNSAVILCLNESAKLEHGEAGDHWISIVGKDIKNSKFLVCCSYTNLEHENSEVIDSDTSRTYNNTLSFFELKKSKIYINSIQKVSASGT